MSGALWTSWIWWLGGGLLLVGSLALLTWALFWDRARGRKRCPRCWYDMSAAPAPGLTCSECGKTVTRERKLFKTRRRKRWALVALVGLIASGYVGVQPRVKERGWWSLVPSSVLIAGLPLASNIDDFWCHELGCRIVAGTGIGASKYQPSDGHWRATLTQTEWAQLFDACVEGDWRARPVSEAWRRKYGALLDLWLEYSFHMPDEGGKAEEHRLLAIPVTLVLETRHPWPTDAQPFVECTFGCWWPRDPMAQAIVTLRGVEMESVHVWHHRAQPLLLPEFDEPERTFVVDAVFQKAERSANAVWEVFGQQEVTITVRRGGTLTNTIRPFEDNTLTDALAATSSVTLYVRDHRFSNQMLDMRATQTAQYEGVAFGFWVDLMYDGEVIASMPYWNRGGLDFTFNMGEYVGDVERVRELLKEEGNWPKWTTRFRSDPALALRVLDADRYWEGEFTTPALVDDPTNPPPPVPQQPPP